MTIFIDTGLFVGLHDADDQNHNRSKELMQNAATGKLGRIYTSDYIIDEALTTALVRTKRHDIAVDLGKSILESPRIIKLTIDQETFQSAWKKFSTLKKNLNFTDCTSLAIMEKQRIKQIMSFDCGFDGLAPRIC